MNFYKVLIIAIVLLFGFSHSVFSLETNELINYKIGDTLEVNTKDLGEHNLIIILGTSECFVCDYSVRNLIDIFEKKHYGSFINIVLTYANSQQVEEYRIRNKLGVEIISDPFGAYKDYFKVKVTPIFIIFNNAGVIEDYGKCGGNFDYNHIENLLSNTLFNNNNKNHQVDNLYLTKFNKNYLTNYLTSIKYEESSKCYFILNRANKSIDFFDSNGVFTNLISLNKIENIEIISPISLQKINDSIYFYTDIDIEANPISYFLNISASKIEKKIEYKNLPNVDTITRLRLDFYFDNLNKLIYLDQQPLDNSYSKTFSSLIVCNTNGEYIKSLDISDKNYLLYSMYNIFKLHFGTMNNDTLYILPDNSDSLFKVCQGDIKESKHLEFPDTYKVIRANLKNNLSPADWKIINKNKSFISSIKFINDKTYITYYNAIFLTNDDVPNDPNSIKFNYYTAVFDKDYQLERSIKYDDDSKPFFFNDSYIYILSYSKHNSKIIIINNEK